MMMEVLGDICESRAILVGSVPSDLSTSQQARMRYLGRKPDRQCPDQRIKFSVHERCLCFYSMRRHTFLMSKLVQ